MMHLSASCILQQALIFLSLLGPLASIATTIPTNFPLKPRKNTAYSETPYAALANLTAHAANEIEILHYAVPNSDINLYFYIDTSNPLDRRALGRTILRTQQGLRLYMQMHGNKYLDLSDDPFEVDDQRTGKCMIGMRSNDAGGPGYKRLTYQGVQDSLQGIWDALYLDRNEYSSIFQISNGSLAVGYGRVVVGNVPSSSSTNDMHVDT